MKIIDAFWERRNLGVDTVEFLIERGDSADVINEIINAEKQYNVIKLPSSEHLLLGSIQDNGYKLVECLLNQVHDLSSDKIAMANKQRMLPSERSEMNSEDIAELHSEIRKGLFHTDRIFNDQKFTKKIAAERYVNWISDEYSKGAKLYKFSYRGKSAGFFIIKILDRNVFNPILAGVYKDFQDKGFGISLAYNNLMQSVELGAKRITTYVSSNNVGMVRSNEILGYEINHMQYVLIKHNEVYQ